MEERGVASNQDLVGVSEQEIQTLEQHFGVEFPKAYRQYLSSFGRSAGYLSPWMAIYFDDLKEIRETFELYVEQGFSFKLPAGALIIANFENTFDFFICKGSHDPAVYRVDFRQENPSAKKFAPSFSYYLDNLVKISDTSTLPEDLFGDDMDDMDDMLDDLMHY